MVTVDVIIIIVTRRPIVGAGRNASFEVFAQQRLEWRYLLDSKEGDPYRRQENINLITLTFINEVSDDVGVEFSAAFGVVNVVRARGVEDESIGRLVLDGSR